MLDRRRRGACSGVSRAVGDKSVFARLHRDKWAGPAVLPYRVGNGLFLGDEDHADGAHAGLGHVPERLQHAACIGAVPLEKREVQADGVVEFDVQHLAAGTTQHGRGLGVNFGEGSE